MCGRVFVIAAIASLAVPCVAEVDASAQIALVMKKEVEDASDVTAASAVNAGAVETGKEALVVSAGEEQQEGEAKEEEVADAEEDEEEEEEEFLEVSSEAGGNEEEDEEEDEAALVEDADEDEDEQVPEAEGDEKEEGEEQDGTTYIHMKEDGEEQDGTTYLDHMQDMQEEKGWDDLSQQQKEDLTLLGWNSSSWAGGEEPGPDSDKLWADLTPAQRKAAERLGYDHHPNAYHGQTWDDSWSELSGYQQQYWMVLGWTQEMWDEGTKEPWTYKREWSCADQPERRDCRGMDDRCRRAAEHLGYDEQSWNAKE